MAEKILNTRIQLKYSTFEEWSNVSTPGVGGNLVLKQGEVGIVAIPADGALLQTTPPAIMFKVGDGKTAFKDLPWASALAADVYAWAKKSAPDVKDFSDIIAAARQGLISADSVVKTLNQFKGDITIVGSSDGYIGVASNENEISLSLNLANEEREAIASGITTEKVTTYDAYAGQISGVKTTAEAAVPKTDFNTFKETNSAAISEAKKAGTDAAAALDTYKTENDQKVSANATDIANLQTAVKAGITFKGKVESLPATTSYSNGDLIIVGTKEYILYDDDSAKTWIELGDEGTHLTKTTADGYYVAKNAAITGGTKAKITYDSKGLVTGGTDLEVSDIPELPTSKITSGTFADARIASAATWNAKQNALSAAQLAATNSGITADKVATYDAYSTGKQDKLSEAQLAAANSGITKAKVTTYDGYESKITALEGKTGLDKVGTVTSVAAGTGLKITGTASVTPKVEIDDGVVFVFDCGSATVNV